MKQSLRLIFVLTLVCLVAGVLLAVANMMTIEPIRKAQASKREQALQKVLPPCDPLSREDVLTLQSGTESWTFQRAYSNGQYVGAAFEISTMAGYGGEIRIMAGVTATGTLHAIEILKQTETPGLGAKISEPSFKDRFKGRPLATTVWKVKKDDGNIDGITAATISSRAVIGAVKRGIDAYLANESNISSKHEQPASEREDTIQ